MAKDGGKIFGLKVGIFAYKAGIRRKLDQNWQSKSDQRRPAEVVKCANLQGYLMMWEKLNINI